MRGVYFVFKDASAFRQIEKYLKPLPVSERADIVKEIKSEMLELQDNRKKEEEIYCFYEML